MNKLSTLFCSLALASSLALAVSLPEATATKLNAPQLPREGKDFDSAQETAIPNSGSSYKRRKSYQEVEADKKADAAKAAQAAEADKKAAALQAVKDQQSKGRSVQQAIASGYRCQQPGREAGQCRTLARSH